MQEELLRAGKYLGQAMRMMVGLPDYGNYVTHMETTHPGLPIMTYEEFFKERQDARYGGAGSSRGAKCC